MGLISLYFWNRTWKFLEDLSKRTDMMAKTMKIRPKLQFTGTIPSTVDFINSSQEPGASATPPHPPAVSIHPTFLDRNRWLFLPQTQKDEEEDQWDEDLKGQHPLEGRKKKTLFELHFQFPG